MTELEKQLTEALQTIGCLPLEFNGRARAIAQKFVTAPAGGWKDHLSPEQITKLLSWAGGPTKENTLSTTTKETVTTSGPVTVKEEPLFPVNPAAYLPPAIEMIPVESSNPKGFGHDGEKTLRVWFLNGTSYDYVGIEEGDFFDLVNAPSAGKAYGALMKLRGIKGIKLQLQEVA